MMKIKLNYQKTWAKHFAGVFERDKEDVELIWEGKAR